MEVLYDGEAYEICAEDCPRIDSECANGVCEGGESYQSCPQDCSLQDILGTSPSDGACQPGEDIDNAPKDCTDIQPNCGNAVCDTWETKEGCYEDCPFGNNGAEGNEGDECSTDFLTMLLLNVVKLTSKTRIYIIIRTSKAFFDN